MPNTRVDPYGTVQATAKASGANPQSVAAGRTLPTTGMAAVRTAFLPQLAHGVLRATLGGSTPLGSSVRLRYQVSAGGRLLGNRRQLGERVIWRSTKRGTAKVSGV